MERIVVPALFSRLAVFLAVLAIALPAQAAIWPGGAPEGWRTSWAASPEPPMPAGAPAVLRPVALNGQTAVQIVRLSAGGDALRLRLSNEYGARPLAVGHVRIALLGPDGQPRPGSAREVTFSGAASAEIPPHAPLLSDPVALKTDPLATLQVSLYLPGDTGPCTCHQIGLQTAHISPPGDFTDKPFTPVAEVEARLFLSDVEVEGPERGPAIIAFGDSITDGFRSTANTNRRWPDRLAERLVAAHRPTPVANAGVSGNRVLGDGVVAIFGESALTRFDRDVLGLPGSTHLIVLEGVNDLGGQPSPTPEALIAGYRQLIARAHEHGLKVVLATLLPYGGAAYYRPDGEAARQAINTWIRGTREADGVIDFDAALRDPADPTRLRANLQSGDWLHPNDAGYRVMGDAVDLKLFR
jgi:lysophospholipase L1-like esterase